MISAAAVLPVFAAVALGPDATGWIYASPSPVAPGSTFFRQTDL